MPRKVILDVDPGIDDAVALALALFDPSLEVVAVTAVAGNVSAEQSTRNVQAIVEQLDPPRWPRIGAAVAPDNPPSIDRRQLFGADGLGNTNLPVAELHQRHLSEKVLTDEIRRAPASVTIIALGPLTNIANAFRRDPALAGMVGEIFIAAGAVTAAGDVSPAAEVNIFYDPAAAHEVFRSASTKTLIPLDVTRQVTLNFGDLDQLPDEESRAGRLLRRILPHAFRAYRQVLGLEGITLDAAVAIVAATNPELFTTRRMAGDVELQGRLTSGATIFDRRRSPEWRNNFDVAMEVESAAVVDAILRGLKRAAEDG